MVDIFKRTVVKHPKLDFLRRRLNVCCSNHARKRIREELTSVCTVGFSILFQTLEYVTGRAFGRFRDKCGQIETKGDKLRRAAKFLYNYQSRAAGARGNDSKSSKFRCAPQFVSFCLDLSTFVSKPSKRPTYEYS